MFGDLDRTGTVRVGTCGRLGAQAIDHPVVHAECRRDQHGELRILVGGSSFERMRDGLSRETSRIV